MRKRTPNEGHSRNVPLGEGSETVIAKLRQLLNYEMTVAEWISLAVLLGIPYGIVGLIWSSTHTDHLRGMHGADLVVSFLGAIVSWPVLLFSNVCMV
jgi:hypothetical protein